ncbi:MAG: hypothetical protein IK999_04680 [Ruminococcus sp.]|nr:hypothetical protein [Ruminococcus sp.]
MKRKVQRKPVSAEQHKNMMRCVAGIMAIEGLTMSDASIHNLDRYVSGHVDYQEILSELKAKYQREK